MSIPDAIKELAKHGITVSKQSIHARIKRKTINFKLIGKKKYVDFEELLNIYGDGAVKQPPSKQPPTQPPTRPKIVLTDSIEQQMKQALLDNNKIIPLTKSEKLIVLAMIQKKFALMALGELKTEKVTYKIINGKWEETNRIVQTHLPSIPFTTATSIVSDLITKIEEDSFEELGESDQEVMDRYIHYAREQKEIKKQLEKRIK